MPIEIGSKIGRLTVVSEAESTSYGGKKHRRFTCNCECGITKDYFFSNLSKANGARSCGCLRSERTSKRMKADPHLYSVTHGCSGSPEYLAWRRMKNRCYNPNYSQYDYYGGRGIAVCDEWKEDFQVFYDHVGDRPTDKHTLDRMDSDKNYEPGNVRWATPDVQANNRRCNRFFEINGEQVRLADAAKMFGLSKGTIRVWLYTRRMSHDEIVKKLLARTPSPSL